MDSSREVLLGEMPRDRKSKAKTKRSYDDATFICAMVIRLAKW